MCHLKKDDSGFFISDAAHWTAKKGITYCNNDLA